MFKMVFFSGWGRQASASFEHANRGPSCSTCKISLKESVRSNRKFITLFPWHDTQLFSVMLRDFFFFYSFLGGGFSTKGYLKMAKSGNKVTKYKTAM